MKIVAIDRQGKEHTLEGRDGWSVMEILRDGGLDIAAECGGACACATCHVFVDPAWYERTGTKEAMEVSMLDFANATEPTSRLSCQIRVTDALDGPRTPSTVSRPPSVVTTGHSQERRLKPAGSTALCDARLSQSSCRTWSPC